MIIPTLDAAIPFVKTLPECADFSKTVEPYIPQLYALPQQILANIYSLDGLKALYLATNPLITTCFTAIFIVAPIALIAAEVNRNYSQIDRVWSILPVLYNSHYALWAHLSGLPTYKLDSVMAVSVLWGARLTFNYWRKGGYEIGSEDYRWVVVRKHAGKWMLLFDILFISFGQSVSLDMSTLA
jgi:steroid 5-alpha reductase family enzyme